MADTWRARFAPIIAQVLHDTAGQSEQEIRKALHDAWPCGERRHFPYKVWLDEIRCQRGKRKFGAKKRTTAQGQAELFGDDQT